MAVPLKYGTQVIGVLDIQSTIPSVFKDEDTNLLGTLSNQLTLAINNAKLSEQSGFNFQSQGRMRGKQISHRQKQSGYSFSADGTISTTVTTNNPLLEKALETGETTIQERPSKERPAVMAVPVKFRDKVIGVIHIEATEESRKWTDDEITVVQSISDRAAFALENARLFEETSRRAEQEETIAHITSEIGSSTDFNHILQTTIEELGRTLGATRTFIQLETPAKDGRTENQHMTE
jgi:GAF domain-containing protein